MGKQELICGDSLKVMRGFADKSFDLVLTDPPYPDYYAEEYKYREGILDFLKELPCRQFIFWSAKVDFPLDYTAIHIWNKQRGVGSEYERIFERNGEKNYKLYTYFSIDSYRAKIAKEQWTTHPSQKPERLIQRLIEDSTEIGDTILDPFMGSGTTLVAAKYLNRNATGIEISEKYCEIARKRLSQEMLF